MILLRMLRTGLLGGPPLPPGCLLLAIVALFGLLGCGVVGLVDNVATLGGVSYWAAQTGTPRPTVTVFLGTTTPVYADTPVPAEVTTTPGMAVTETPPPPVTTTPSLNLIGLTTPEPTERPYYRVGSFYMNSDVYIGAHCPRCLVFRITGHETQASPNDAGATYHFITVRVTNHGDAAVIVPVSDVLFIRHVEQGGGRLTGRWTAQNEPLIARGLPAYDAQQLAPLAAGATREFVAGFVVPEGEVRELGLITNWTMPVEGGLPVWFFLEDDPLGPFVDAVLPPPPTPAVLDEAGSYAGGPSGGGAAIGMPGPVVGRWPAPGRITRGFGCHEYYTGISGEGWGCPEETPWFHNGVDIANSTGTAIVSPVDGAMLYAGPNSAGPDCSHIAGSEAPHEGLGNYQRLAGGGTVHYFGHLSSFAVTAGDVTAGQTVAGMGSTGCSTGPHLHWIVYQGANLVDPAVWAGPGP
jgi:hypothetical protein